MEKIICPICGSLVGPEPFRECDYCNWVIMGDIFEDEEDDGYNPVTRGEAKRLYAKGLDIWGEPIKK